MPAGVALLVLDSLLKIGGGFIIGFCVRDLAAKKNAANTKSGKASSKRKGVVKASRKTVPEPREELKMVLIVNMSLKMGTGKIGAQCAHAAVGVLQEHMSSHEVAIRQWARCAQPKIALKAPDEAELERLQSLAIQNGFPTYLVCDAGRTQIAAGSRTVLAIGPAPKSALDMITGQLKLL